ncbi:unnamed protein product [Urochloa humidicola]
MKQAAIHSHVKFQRKKVVGRAHAASSVVGKKLAKAAWVEWEREMLRVADERSEAPDGDLELELGVLHASRRGARPPPSSQRQAILAGTQVGLPSPSPTPVRWPREQGRAATQVDLQTAATARAKGPFICASWLSCGGGRGNSDSRRSRRRSLKGGGGALLGRVGGGGARGCEESAGDACF